MKLLFAREPQQGVRAWCLIVLSILLMIADHRYHRLDVIRNHLSIVVYPIQWVVNAPAQLVSSWQQYTLTYQQLAKQNEQLKEQQLLQSARIQKFMALEAENARLRELLHSSPGSEESLLAAEIIRVNADPFTHRVILDKGTEHGISVGQPVIDSEGIIGEVIEVYPTTSRIILLTDASYGIPIEGVRNGVRGIAVGTGAIKSLELQHVPNTVDLKEGDTLVTSGLDGRYPAGYPVGVISRIENDPGEPFARIQVTPIAKLERSRQVLLIQRSNKEPIP